MPKSVAVLVGTALPGAVRVAEVARDLWPRRSWHLPACNALVVCVAQKGDQDLSMLSHGLCVDAVLDCFYSP